MGDRPVLALRSLTGVSLELAAEQGMYWTSKMARIREIYFDQVMSALKEELGFANVMQVPRLSKIVVNMGLGEGATNSKLLEHLT